MGKTRMLPECRHSGYYAANQASIANDSDGRLSLQRDRSRLDNAASGYPARIKSLCSTLQVIFAHVR